MALNDDGSVLTCVQPEWKLPENLADCLRSLECFVCQIPRLLETVHQQMIDATERCKGLIYSKAKWIQDFDQAQG